MSAVRRCSRKDCTGRVVGRRLCRKHYQQAWKRGDFVNAPIPHRPRNPIVCPPEHKHDASSTCFILHQCRCDPCMDHHNAMEANRRKQKAYGRYDVGLVDAEPVREHMMMLAEFGMGYKRVAALAGIGITPTRNLIWGRQDPGPRYGELQKRVKRETAEALLAVKPELENLAGGARIPARGTQRRLRALVAIGWSQSKLADRLGVERGNFGVLMTAKGCTAARARAVTALYDELSNRLPPREEWRDKIAYSRSVRHAAERGWPSPWDWEAYDNDFDRPHAPRRSAA